jgi:hypothetical protein
LQECDECNSFFSENIEVHLDKFTRPFRTIAQIRGKSGVPSYKTKDKKSRIDFNKDKGLVSLETLDRRISDIDQERKKLTFNFEYEPYIPSAVHKSLVKMALSIMPEDELRSFQHSIKWILNPDHSNKLITPQILRAIFIPGPNPNRILTAFLLRRKKNCTTEGIPFCVFVIGFGNFVFQVTIPSSNDKSGSFIVPFFPTPFELGDNDVGVGFMRFDLSSHEIVRDKKETFTFSYDGIEEIKE